MKRLLRDSRGELVAYSNDTLWAEANGMTAVDIVDGPIELGDELIATGDRDATEAGALWSAGKPAPIDALIRCLPRLPESLYAAVRAILDDSMKESDDHT